VTAPLPGSGHATSADQHRQRAAATRATCPAAVTCAVAGSGRGWQNRETGFSGIPGLVLAATATHVHPLALTLALAVLAAVWLVRAWLWPFAPCRRCKGSKTNIGSNRKRFGNCRRCGGSGARIRFGARTVHRALLRRKEPR
jgi:hypothetical protein